MLGFQPRLPRRFGNARGSIPGILLTALLVGSFLGAVFHVVSAGHDSSQCSACAWLQVHGWILVNFAFLTFFASQRLVGHAHLYGVTRPHRRPRSRSPPLG